jgi:coenzyme F420-reducing hydrogenase delta subunit/ferredoxin
MVPHPNQRIGRSLAVVDADLCAACGICAGACPSSTPFRRAGELVTGIDMPQLTVGVLRARLRRALQAQRAAGATHPLVLFGCAHGAHCSPDGADDGSLGSARAAPADGSRTAEVGADTSAFRLLCTGQLPPSFVEYALRDGAAGVVVAACREGGCEFRLGERWTAERLRGRREPHLRSQVPAERLELVYAGPGDEPLLAAAVERLRARVRRLGPERGVEPLAEGLHHA